MRTAIALVLGGGRGTRLLPLTKYRSKPAVPLAARYRLIDIPLSNCINSGLNRIYVLTQFMSVSLHRHIRQTYRFDHFSGAFVELLAAQQTMESGTDWYQGTADAVRKNLRYLQQPNTEYVVILSGDQLYRMDYRAMLKTHIENKADVTIAAMPVARSEAHALGVMRADDDGRVTGFLEKPQTEDELSLVRTSPEWFRRQGLEVRGDECLASMGIYIFKRDTLVDLLKLTDYRDFGKEIFPVAIRTKRVQAHLFDDYWEDIGTIRAFYESNLSLCKPNPPFSFNDPNSPIFTRPRFLPPTVIHGAEIEGSLVAEGCSIARGAVIRNSIIGLRCVVGEGARIENSVLMGADFYDEGGATALGVGAGAQISGAIVDKNCRIGAGARIIGRSDLPDSPTDDDRSVVIQDQIPVVVKDSVIPADWEL